jgi:hypothetical protein
MAKFKIPLETLNDPEHVRALYHKFGDLLKVISKDSELPYREFQVDIPGFDTDTPVHIVFGFGSANLVSIIDIVPDVETQIRNQKINISTLKAHLLQSYPDKTWEVNEFISSLRYDYHPSATAKDVNMEEFLNYMIPSDNLLNLFDRFKVFINLTPNDRVWVRPVTGVKYKVISKINDTVCFLDEYRIDYFSLISTITQ